MLQLTILTRNGFVTFHFPWHWLVASHQTASAGNWRNAPRLAPPSPAPRTHARCQHIALPPCTLQLAADCWPPSGTTMRLWTLASGGDMRHPLKIGSRQPQIVPIPNSANLRSHWPPPIVSNVVNWSLYNNSTHSLPGLNSVVTRRLHTSTHHQIRQS